jgi:hypothetical protein
MTHATATLALRDIMLGSEPEVLFVVGRSYATRGVFCRDGAVRHQSAKVIGQVNDGMGRLHLVVKYSDGLVCQVTDRGSCALGWPHSRDLVAPC